MISKTVVDVTAQKATVDSCGGTPPYCMDRPPNQAGERPSSTNLRFSKMYQHDLYLEDGVWKIGSSVSSAAGQSDQPVPARTIDLAAAVGTTLGPRIAVMRS